MMAPAAKAHVVLIAITTRSLAVAYRKRVKNETGTSRVWICRRMICASSSCLEEFLRSFTSEADGADIAKRVFRSIDDDRCTESAQ